MDYLGAEGDSRFPSPRRLRSVIATLVDLALFAALTISVIMLQMFVFGLQNSPAMLVVYACLLVAAFIQYFLLPAWAGGTVGQLICGLTLVRCRDAARPRIRDITRAMGKSSARLRVRGIHALAPHLVVVRRCDLARAAVLTR
ncbi:RDD family protein [Nocardia sp. NPDC050406]|uniref:RDD family protein n=1 Tax=Nocardia sp. NPDC050406 TaxID=3364318 RepID=UPI003791A2E5